MNLRKNDIANEGKRLLYALVIPGIVLLFILLMFWLQAEYPWLTRALANFPRDYGHLHGAITSLFLHGSWQHLLNNGVSFLILSWMLFYLYRTIALQVFLQLWLYSGIMLWIMGRANYHIGASGLIFALAFFLMASGAIRRQQGPLALAFVVIFLYGGMFWSIFPWEATYDISWECHLSGALVGVALAFIYRKRGPQPPPEINDDDIDDNNPYWIIENENSDEQRA